MNAGPEHLVSSSHALSTMPATSQLTLSYTKNVTLIKRVSTLQEFRQFVMTHDEPVAYTIPKEEQFSAFSKWDYDFLATSKHSVRVRRFTSDRSFDIRNSSVWELAKCVALRHQVELGDYVKRAFLKSKQGQETRGPHELLSGSDMHLRINFADKPEFQDLLDDIATIPEMFLPGNKTKEDIHAHGLWISAGGTSSQTHFDKSGDHNMNFQIRGKKLFTLYEPQDGAKHLYPMPWRMHNISLVDPYEAGIETQFPRLVHSKPYVIELQAGEVLFIPAMWWHDVRHMGDLNVNVTTWFTSPQSADNSVWKWPCLGETFCDTARIWFYMGKFLVVVFVAVAMLLSQRLADLFCSLVCTKNFSTDSKLSLPSSTALEQAPKHLES